jgi:hypothetical protein
MTHNTWMEEKPEFTEECILITARRLKMPLLEMWEYALYEIKCLEGVDESDHAAYYWGICEPDGEEWGAWEDYKADKYFTMPLLK